MAIDDVDYTASGYIEAITPDGVVISRHRQEREAQQACFQHAKDNEDLLGDGVHEYTIRPAEIRMSIRLLSPVGAPNNGEVDVTPPLAPAGVGVDEIGAGSARVFWASNLEPDILDYRVYLSTTSASTGFSLWETTSNTESTITGLSEEQEFWVRVTARDNALNESEYSATVTGTSLPPVWIDASELASLPTSGTVWDELETRAYSSFSGPAGGNNDIADTNTLATALVAATGDSTMLAKCQGLLDDAVTDAIVGDTSLSACRNLTSYAIAADLIGYEDTTFVNWMKTVVARDFESWGAGQDGNSMGEGSIFWKIWKVNNHGSMALACFAAISRYLQRIEPDNSQWQDNLDHVFQCLRYYMGEEPGIIPSDLGYTGKSSWNYGPNSENWQQLHDSNYYVIYPQGATDGTNNIDGLLPEAARRGSATYVYPAPSGTTYYWEFLQGLTVALHIMDRAGYSVLPLGNYAHRRAIQYLYDVIGTPITGDDAYQAPLIDFMYGVSAIQSGGLWDQASVDQGKNMGWTGWSHGLRNTYLGDNAARVRALLDNYTLPAAWGGDLEYPADPVTTREVPVDNATDFNTAAGVAGTKITVTGSFSGNIEITADDIDVMMDNAYTITGDLTMDTGSMVSRVRWTGGNVGAGNAQSWRPVSDVLFDDVVFFGRIDLDSRPTPGPSRRVAFINSTITTIGSSSGEDIDFTLETVSRNGISRHSDIIVANCLVENQNNSPTRFGWSERTVFVESYFHTNPISTGFRFSSQSQDAFLAGRSGKAFIFAGRMHLSYDLFGGSHGIHDATLDNVNGYIQYNTIGIDPDISGSNTGTVSNSTLYIDGAGGDPMSTYPFSAGSGNTALTQAWDGSTLPSSSSYGAQR